MKVSPKYLVFLISSSLIWLASCKHEPTINPKDINNGNHGQGIPCDPDTVYFYNDIFPLINSTCATANCHDDITQEDGKRLTDYQSIIADGEIEAFKPNEGELMEVIQETDLDDRMPPPPANPLTTSQIQMIKKWISQGALENACKDTLCDTTNVMFQNVVWPILNLNCKGCHNSPNPGGNVLITNYNDVKLIADNGFLKGTIEHQSFYSPMPKNQSKLDSCKIAQINKWINEGAQNN